MERARKRNHSLLCTPLGHTSAASVPIKKVCVSKHTHSPERRHKTFLSQALEKPKKTPKYTLEVFFKAYCSFFSEKINEDCSLSSQKYLTLKSYIKHVIRENKYYIRFQAHSVQYKLNFVKFFDII